MTHAPEFRAALLACVVLVVSCNGSSSCAAPRSAGSVRGRLSDQQPTPRPYRAVGIEYFVSPGGSDSNPGTAAEPFATLERGQAAVRALRAGAGLPADGVAVTIRGATFQRTSAWAFTSDDSGTAERPVIYRSYPGETVRVVGGKVLPAASFAQVTSSDPVWPRLAPQAQAGGGTIWKVDLAAAGVTTPGSLQKRGWGAAMNASWTVEPSFDGAAMQIARWPDPGTNDAANHVRDGMAMTSAASDANHVTYHGSLPARWNTALSRGDAWLHAWSLTWADAHVHVSSGGGGSYTLDVPLPYGGVQSPGMPYYVENLLEEITLPGEWYIDRSTGILYLWPPALPLSNHEVVVSTMADPVLTLSGAAHLTFQGISFESSRTDIVQIDAASSYNTIQDCAIRNSGWRGASIDGHDNRIDNCELTGSGASAVELTGGTYATLTPGNNSVENSHVHHNSRWDCPRPAIFVRGVANKVMHNHLHDGPYAAIQFEGNDHQFAYNDIHDFVKWSGDGGAVYSGANGTWRGNELRYNFVRNIKTWFDPTGWTPGTGVYLDDLMSSVHVFGNVFMDIHGSCVYISGGRDNVVENNIFVRCGSVALYVQATGRRDEYADNTLRSPHSYAESASIYTGDTWATHARAARTRVDQYARLAALGPVTSLTTGPIVDGYANWRHPGGNVWARNLGFGNGYRFDQEAAPDTCWKYFHEYGTPGSPYSTNPTTNIPNGNPKFVDESDLTMGVAADSPVYAIPGWTAIPFGEVGIVR